MEVIQLRGHHISTLALYIINKISDKGPYDDVYERYQKRKTERDYGQGFLKNEEKLYEKIVNEEVQIQIVRIEDTVCGYCPKERSDNCKGLTDNNEDDKTITAYGFNLNQVYSNEEFFNHLFAYMDRTGFMDPRSKDSHERNKAFEEKHPDIMDQLR